jgi:hypothetical protein
MATTTVGTSQRNGHTQAQKFSAGVSLGWPTERWMGLIVLTALGLLILIRLGFRGVGFTGNVSGGARIGL